MATEGLGPSDRSYYNRTGSFGFIYRLASSDEEEMEQESSAAMQQRTDRSSEEHSDVRKLSSLSLLSDDTREEDDIVSDDTMEEDDNEGEAMNNVLLKKLLRDVRLSCLPDADGEKVDEALKLLYDDLKKSDSYQQLLMADNDTMDQPRTYPPSPSTELILGSAEQMKTSVALYHCELDEWKKMIADNKAQWEDLMKMHKSRRNNDLTQLHPDDVAILLPHLTPEQHDVLHRPGISSPGFLGVATKKEESIRSKCQTRLKQLRAYCDQVDSINLDSTASAIEDTPRTLFRAIQDHK